MNSSAGAYAWRRQEDWLQRQSRYPLVAERDFRRLCSSGFSACATSNPSQPDNRGRSVNSSPAWGLLLSEFYRTRNPKHDSPVEGLLERGINISRNARSRASDNQSDLRKVLLRLPTSTSLSRTASFILYEPGTGDFAPVGVPGDSESRNLINEIPTSIYRWFPTYVASCLEALILPN